MEYINFFEKANMGLLQNKGTVEKKNAYLTHFCIILGPYPTNIYLIKVNNGNTRKRCAMFKVNNKKTRTMSLMSFR